jgi:hypothetical protein
MDNRGCHGAQDEMLKRAVQETITFIFAKENEEPGAEVAVAEEEVGEQADDDDEEEEGEEEDGDDDDDDDEEAEV